MQYVIDGRYSDLVPDYSTELALANDASALCKQLNLQLAASQISNANVNSIIAAVNSISATTPAGKLNRVKAAIMLIMCAPEYLVQK